MHSPWQALRESLVRSVTVPRSVHRFDQMKEHEPSLPRFGEPAALVGFMTGSSGDLDEKDRILAALIRCCQANEGNVEVAVATAMLSLWPGLDAVHRRQKKRFRRDPDELVAEISSRFTTTFRNANLDRMNRIAATLVRNVERDVTQSLLRRWSEEERRVSLPAIPGVESFDPVLRDPAARIGGDWGVSDLGLAGSSSPDDLAALHTLLRQKIGEDADAVVEAAILGLSQREIGERLGISHEAARKRIQRAMERLRRLL